MDNNSLPIEDDERKRRGPNRIDIDFESSRVLNETGFTCLATATPANNNGTQKPIDEHLNVSEDLRGRSTRWKSEVEANNWIPITAGYKVQKQSLKKFRRIIRMLVVIVLVFVVCWTPYLLMNVLQSFGVVDSQLQGLVKHLKTTFILMAYLNSALNPIIYGFMSRSFRDRFLHRSFCDACCFCYSRRHRGHHVQQQGQRQQPQRSSTQNKQLRQARRDEPMFEMTTGLRANRSRGRFRGSYSDPSSGGGYLHLQHRHNHSNGCSGSGSGTTRR